MKKSVTFIMAILLITTLCACNGTSSTSPAPTNDTDWPTKPITVLCPWTAGGGSDICIRTLMPYVEAELGTTINVVNKTGANGWVAWSELANAEPDGYTIGQINIPAIYSGYLDPQQNRKENLGSFRLIANQISDWGTMAIKKGDTRFSTAKEFIEYAKTHELLAGDSGKGSNKHMVTENLKATINGLQLTPVHQPGWADSYAALLGGHIDVAWGSIGEILQGYTDGELEVLCIFAPERSEVLPDIPTFNELGYGEILSPSDRGYFMPAGVDDAIYNKIVDAFDKAINNPEHIQKMADLGMVVNYIGGEDFAKYAKENETAVANMADVMGWK